MCDVRRGMSCKECMCDVRMVCDVSMECMVGGGACHVRSMK